MKYETDLMANPIYPLMPLGVDLRRIDIAVEVGRKSCATDQATDASFGSEAPVQPLTRADFKDSAAAAARAARPWGDMGEDQDALAQEIEVELEREDLLVDTRKILDVVRDIALGVKPRPLAVCAPREGLHTSYNGIADMAGVTLRSVYVQGQGVELMERFIPRLEGICYAVKMQGSVIVPLSRIDVRVAEALLKDEANNVRLPGGSKNGSRMSILTFCRNHSLPYPEVRGSGAASGRLLAASKRKGAIGKMSPRVFDHARIEVQVAGQLAFMEKLFTEGKPLPAVADAPHRIDEQFIHDAVDPEGPYVERRSEIVQHRRKHRDKFGLSPVEPMTIEGMSGIQFREHVKACHLDCRGKVSLGNFMSAVNRVMEVLTPVDAGPLPYQMFDDLDELAKKAAVIEPALGQRSIGNLRSHIKFMAECATEIRPQADGYPASLEAALAFALRRSPVPRNELLARVGLTEGAYRSIISNRKHLLPPELKEPIAGLDHLLHAKGALNRRFVPDDRAGRSAGSAFFKTFRRGYNRYLPADAHLLSDAELRDLKKEIDDKVRTQDRPYSSVSVAAREIWRQIPLLPEAAPVIGEINDLIEHKRGAIPADGKPRRAKGVWNSSTADMKYRIFTQLFRWMAASSDIGGLGIPPERLTFGLLLDWRIPLSYIDWRAGRFVSLPIDAAGTRRGPVLTTFETTILKEVASLLDRNYGWIVQNRERILTAMEPFDFEYRGFDNLNTIDSRLGDEGDTYSSFISKDNPANEGQKLSLTEARLTLLRGEFIKEAGDARNTLLNLQVHLEKVCTSSRKPFEPIAVILESNDPLAYLTEILQRAHTHLPDEPLHPYAHALGVRNLLIFTMLTMTTLRSKNLRNLTVGPSGQVSQDADGVRIIIPFQRFKNLGSWRLFGVAGNRYNYDRKIKSDLFDIGPLLSHYLKDCRKVLIVHFVDSLKRAAIRNGEDPCAVRTDTNQLFPVPSLLPMKCVTMNSIVKEMTRLYHVLDGVTGRARPGHFPFGPHAVRDIVATHIISNSDDPNRFEHAADLLQTSPDMVRTRYAFQDVAERTGRSDNFFEDQQALFKKR